MFGGRFFGRVFFGLRFFGVGGTNAPGPSLNQDYPGWVVRSPSKGGYLGRP